MNAAFLIQCVAAPVALYGALQAFRLAQAPGWRHHRWFAMAALGAAAFDGCAAAITAQLVPADLVPVFAGLELAALGLMVVAWARYADAFVGHVPGAAERLGRWITAAASIPGLVVPGSFYTGPAVTRAALGGTFVYQDVQMTTLAVATSVLVFAGVLPTTVRFAVAWRRGVPTARVHFAAMGVTAVMGLLDLLTGVGLLDGPYLLDIGFVLPVAAVASASARRLVEDTRALGDLRVHLEQRVRESSRALARAQDDLHDAQRLASLGQLAAGLALEVNAPATTVASSFRVAADRVDPGPGQVDVREAALEGLAAIERVSRLTRQLSQVGRLAVRRPPGATCDLDGVVESAAAGITSRYPDRIRIEWRCPPTRVAASASDLHDLLMALLANAAEAVPPGADGRVEIALRRSGEALALVVDDDGRGIGEVELARAFEPFFTTKPPGQGPGLGLTLARALAERHGGGLRLERRAGRGTRAVLTLPEAGPATPGLLAGEASSSPREGVESPRGAP